MRTADQPSDPACPCIACNVARGLLSRPDFIARFGEASPAVAVALTRSIVNELRNHEARTAALEAAGQSMSHDEQAQWLITAAMHVRGAPPADWQHIAESIDHGAALIKKAIHDA